MNRGQHYKDGVCLLCERPIGTFKDGAVHPHSWQPVDPNVDVQDYSTNAISNLAERARQRTKK